MSSVACSCCAKLTEKHLIVTCSVCQKNFNNGCAGVSASEARIINSKKSISWDCNNCGKIGGDMKSLKSALILLQDEIKQLKSRINDSGTNTSLNNDTFEEIVREVEERRVRGKNVIVIGLPEPDSSVSNEQRLAHEKTQLKRIFSHLLPDLPFDNFSSFRLGKSNANGNRPRLLKANFQNEDIVRQLLRKSNKLKDSVDYKHIIISSDKTPKQIEHYRVLKRELEERISNGEHNIKIKYIKGIPKIVNDLN